MPEIMSAEEVIDTIPLERKWGDIVGIYKNAAAGIIRSRDSAMLEKYKDKINSFAIGHQTILLMLAALDLAFSEIEGGK